MPSLASAGSIVSPVHEARTATVSTIDARRENMSPTKAIPTSPRRGAKVPGQPRCQNSSSVSTENRPFS